MAKGLWEEQLIEKQAKFKRQLKIRVWAVTLMVALDFLAMFLFARLFVQDVAGGAQWWLQMLWFVIALTSFFWMRRDAARLVVLMSAVRKVREGK